MAWFPSDSASPLTRVADAHVPISVAPDARFVAYRSANGVSEHIAVVFGDVGSTRTEVVVHHGNRLRDVIQALTPNAGVLDRAVAQAAGFAGVLIYLNAGGASDRWADHVPDQAVVDAILLDLGLVLHGQRHAASVLHRGEIGKRPSCGGEQAVPHGRWSGVRP